KVLGIAPVAIIDHQLPFEYTVTSRSTDVMVLSDRCLKDKLSGNNFNNWFRQLKLVLRVKNKMYVIEQPIPPAPAADSATNRQFENYSPYEMLKELKSMFEKQDGVERFNLIKTFHACKQEEGKRVAAYVLKMKDI
ncbi:hypothetical protein Tco_0034710, partial [Tanacetum coccineum]